MWGMDETNNEELICSYSNGKYMLVEWIYPVSSHLSYTAL